MYSASLMKIVKNMYLSKMIVLDVLYTGLATVCVMGILHALMFIAIKLIYPPPPRIIYRDVPAQPQVQVQREQVYSQPVVLTEPPPQEIKLPEYEPRQQASDSLRLDPQLPIGIKETRPPGT
jgi:hypothetical protein